MENETSWFRRKARDKYKDRLTWFFKKLLIYSHIESTEINIAENKLLITIMKDFAKKLSKMGKLIVSKFLDTENKPHTKQLN